MFWNGKKVVVTGAGGFIGSQLVEQLLKEGAYVTAIVRYNSQGFDGWLDNVSETLKPNLSITRMHLQYGESLLSVLRDKDVVFNLAAHVGIPYSYVNPQEVIENNICGTLNLLLASRNIGIGKFVQTSTSEVFGSARQIPIPESHVLQPQSPYAASKIATDSIAMSFYYSYGMPITVVRPFNTFGPRQSARAIIPSLISQALSGDDIKVGTSTTTRDFTYVEDTICGFMMIAESENTIGHSYNLGTGIEYSIGEIINKIMQLTNSKAKIVTDQARIRPERSEVQRLCSDNLKVRKNVGWEPKITLDEGLKKTVDWIKSHLSIYDNKSYNI
jgi:NAD dependent epimerase/dehydratase